MGKLMKKVLTSDTGRNIATLSAFVAIIAEPGQAW